ncbi:MAG: phosphate-starvation-inducible PsiE family protein [Actinobacteria bacterium]|nr:phosphate-starvation-inducible PsiE family protein [Actinomycetota bacterium]
MDLLIIAVLAALAVGTVKVFLNFASFTSYKSLHRGFSQILNDVLVVFVFLELFRSLLEYFKEERVKITYLADATLVFLFKEVWVSFFFSETQWIRMVSLASILLITSIIRTLAVIYSPSEEKE